MAQRLGEPLASALAEGRHAGLLDAAMTAMTAGQHPRIAVFEDVHWADELILDLLGFLARRIETLRLLVVATYRDDEIGGTHPTRVLLGDIGRLPGVAQVKVPPLTPEEVGILAAGHRVDPEELHRRTEGNALFVSEVLASGDDGVPVGLTDAVMARCARLGPAALHALEAAAVVGLRSEPRVLLAMQGVRAGAVDECVARGLLQFEPPHYLFRHELARQAVLGVLRPQRLAGLHAEVLDLLREEDDPDMLARLSVHAAGCGDTVAVQRFAPAAAERAALLGGHREAARQYRLALSHSGRLEPIRLAELREALSYELHLTSALDEAIEERRLALALREQLNDTVAGCDNLRWLSRMCWYAGQIERAREYGDLAIEMVRPLGPTPALAKALSNRSQLLMLRNAYPEAIAAGNEALQVATAVGDLEARVHALNNIGLARGCTGDPTGLDLVEESLSLALAAGWEDHAARAMVNITFSATLRRDNSLIERHLGPALDYCAARDLDLQWRYLEATRAMVLLNRGAWSAAYEVANALYLRPTLNTIHRFVASHPLVLITLRRGELTRSLLAEFVSVGSVLDEPQRMVPTLLVRAERAWLAGAIAEIEPELVAAEAEALARSDFLCVAEIAWWLRRTHPDRPPPPAATGPFARAARLPVRAAADLWLALDSPYEAAIELLAGARSQVTEALNVLELLGATPAARIARRVLAGLGARAPRRGTAVHPFGLTAREAEVLDLIVARRTNAEIAESLVISERTVHHHVSSVIGKLGVRTRAEAATVAEHTNVT